MRAQPLRATVESTISSSSRSSLSRRKKKPSKLSDAEVEALRPPLVQTKSKPSTPKPPVQPRQYVVKRFLDYRVTKGEHELLTQWASFSREEASWIPLGNASAAEEALRTFCTSRREAGLPYPPTSPPLPPLPVSPVVSKPLQGSRKSVAPPRAPLLPLPPGLSLSPSLDLQASSDGDQVTPAHCNAAVMTAMHCNAAQVTPVVSQKVIKSLPRPQAPGTKPTGMTRMDKQVDSKLCEFSLSTCEPSITFCEPSPSLRVLSTPNCEPSSFISTSQSPRLEVSSGLLPFPPGLPLTVPSHLAPSSSISSTTAAMQQKSTAMQKKSTAMQRTIKSIPQATQARRKKSTGMAIDNQAESKICAPSSICEPLSVEPSISNREMSDSHCEPSISFIANVSPVREIPLFDALPLLSEILPSVLQSCRDARQIPALPPPLWKVAALSAWELELTRLGLMIDNALAQPTEINLFNTLFSLLSAPGAILAPLLKITKQTVRFASSDASVNAALRKIAKGQEARAFKLLCSNGIAKVNDSVVDALKALHPKRQDELKLPTTDISQVSVDEEAVAKKLFRAAADFSTSRDVFGWAPWMFYTCRAKQKGFFSSYVKLVCLIANKPRMFPSICGVLLTAGVLTPLHKLPPDERRQREDANLEPKLRPINASTLLAKTALSAVLETPAAVRSTSKLEPHQLAIGVSRGVEKLVHICRAAHAKGWLVGRNDFTNGFNSLSRQKMLEANRALFPESVDVFNLLYGSDSPILLFNEDCEVSLLTSSEGPRQGCSAGTHAFALTLQPLLLELQSKYPEFEIRVLTDDIIPLVPPPADPAAWQQLYLRYGCFLRDLCDLALQRAGLSLNMDKCGLLLPESAPAPSPEVRAAFPALFDFQTDGFRVAGSPIGKASFIAKFVESKIFESIRKLDAIKEVGYKSPRAAHRLMTTCVIKLTGFLSATVPPSFMLPMLRIFDEHVESTFLHLLNPVGFECSQERMERAKLKASLPSPHGCGLFKTVNQGSVSWWASVAACMTDPLLFQLRAGLTTFVPAAWNAAVEALGGTTTKFWTQAKQLFPPNQSGLLDGSRYSPAHAPSRTRLCKAFGKLCTKRNVENYQQVTSTAHLSPTLSKADILHANARTLAGGIFREPCNSKLSFEFSPEAYISWCCFFLGLPPVNTLNNHVISENFDYPVQKCQSVHAGSSPFLDVVGCHASSNCPSAYSARNRRHNYIMRVLASAAKEAGLNSKLEPDTFNLLLGDFSQANCKRMFPKAASKLYKDRVNAVVNAVELISSPACTLSDADKRAYVQVRIDALPAVAKEDAVGLRIDLELEDPATGETKWVDATVVHTAAESYREREFKAMMARNVSASTAAALAATDVLKFQASPIVLERAAAKVEKYARIIWIAKKQAQQKKRRQAPVFSAFCVSDFGELSPSAFNMLDWLVDKRRSLAEQAGPRADGVKPLEIVCQFKHRLRMDIQMAIAAGSGEMFRAAGQAWARR